MTSLLYDGVLSSHERRSIIDALDKYPHAIEANAFPGSTEFHRVYDDRTWTHFGEDCMGGNYTQERKGVPYCIVWKNFPKNEGCFILLPDQNAYDRFLEAFPQLVVNAKPFKTVLTLHS